MVLQTPTILKQLEAKVGRMLVRIALLIATIILVLHLSACVFHYAAVLEGDNETWVDASGVVRCVLNIFCAAPVSSICTVPQQLTMKH